MMKCIARLYSPLLFTAGNSDRFTPKIDSNNNGNFRVLLLKVMLLGGDEFQMNDDVYWVIR